MPRGAQLLAQLGVGMRVLLVCGNRGGGGSLDNSLQETAGMAAVKTHVNRCIAGPLAPALHVHPSALRPFRHYLHITNRQRIQASPRPTGVTARPHALCAQG